MRQGSHVSIWKKILGRERRKQRPEERASLAGVRNGREASVAGGDERKEEQEGTTVSN